MISGVTAGIALPLMAFIPILPVLPVLSAQTARAAGQVVRSDSTPVPKARVVLHRIGRDRQGPIDSSLSDRRGRFQFTFRADSTAFYLLSARNAGIEYFSRPVATNPERPDSGIHIVVYDTSSTVPVSLEARHLVVTRPGEDGSRGVLDLMVLRNDAQLTRVAPDTTHPTWSAPLPGGTIGLEVAESDFSRDAVGRRDDSVIVVAPLAPGEKQLTVQYLIPSNRSVVELPFSRRGAAINVLAEEKAVRVSGSGMALADSQVIQGRAFRRWTGVATAGGMVRIELPGIRRTPTWLLAALVGAMTLALGATAWYTLRRPAVPAPGPGDLLDQLAALDARYQAREEETPPGEWSSYLSERARLKALLETSLAAGRRVR